jgi:hypothetical protein
MTYYRLEDLGIVDRIISKLIFKSTVGGFLLDSFGSGQRSMAGSCFCSIKEG